jgi:NIMA (never in mitosis gene a)-related kinase
MEKYRKIKVVGKGSFGHAVLVQTANDPNKHYIMKIIDVSKMERKQKEEALNEVHVLKAMRHPFICTYRESFMEKRCLCIVMDYADGGDLYTRIAKQKERGDLFTEKQILDWFVQIALALKHVHDRKILHRDIKTQNIFLTSKSEIKLGDFGIARILQNTDDCAKTAIGTPYYLSPEICQEKPYNQKSDIWSLGCILYEMVTLNHAFDADNMKSLVMKILKADYSPIPSIYSDNLKLLISEMLIKDPAQRPSIKKILQKDFLSSRISDLLMSTLTRHTTYDSGNQYRSNQSKVCENILEISML